MNFQVRLYFPLLLALCFSFFIFTACNFNPKPNQNQTNNAIESGKDNKNLYAGGFRIENFKGFKLVKVFNPWEFAKGIQYTYVLCDSGTVVPDSLKKYDCIITPVRKIVCLSTTHIAFLKALNQEKVISGVAAPEYIYDPGILKAVEKGNILNVGYDQALNIETILSLKPDLVMAYGVGGESSGQYQRLKELGIKVVYNAEYLETTPLGKAEWIKFVGAFLNREARADSIFKHTVKSYMNLSQIAVKSSVKPMVLSGLPWKGVWYVPGGNSYAACFIKDAGGNYLWNSDTGTESLPLSLETVMEKANQAQVWINPGSVSSLSEIAAMDQRMTKIQSFQKKAVYNFNARLSPGGGNDFWESGVVYPDLILKDLIAIFHPELIPNHTFVYYKKLN